MCNLFTIYGGKSSNEILRRMAAEEGYEEKGYLVYFCPGESRGKIFFSCRRELDERAIREICSLLESVTRVKVPMEREHGLLFSPHAKGSVFGYSAKVRQAGISWFRESSGNFEMDVYFAESFSERLAEWLDEYHSAAHHWVCDESTKPIYPVELGSPLWTR